MPSTIVDIRCASLREFEDFVFEHAVYNVGSDEVWYHQSDLNISFNATHNARRFIEMFTNAYSLLAKYDRGKLEQGCWAMFGAGFAGNLNELIWESDITLEIKEELISSMYFVYRDLFSIDPLGSSCEMWWDGLAYEIHPMQRADTVNNVEHKRIQDAMFDTLSRIIQIESSDCQLAALHGLNHVSHPGTERVVKNYVQSRPDLTDAQIKYAFLCANGCAL